MNVNIKQIAKEAQVSPQTVSRVINHHPDVAADTRKRVQEVIQRLGYQPNTIARSLVRQRSHTLGVIISAVDHYGPSHLLAGMAQQARQLGYKLLLNVVSSADAVGAEETLRSLLAHQVDGIIWAAGEVGDAPITWERKLSSLRVPAIYMGEERYTSLPFVSPDNRRGARVVTEHLLSQGHRHIGLIMGPAGWWVSDQRKAGWREALTAAGLAPRPCQISQGDWSAASGERAARLLFAEYPEMDALFASNDQMALGALKAASQAGKRVPQDLAVSGFDGMPEAAYFAPPLTTVRYPMLEMGATAVGELDRIITARRDEFSAYSPHSTWFQPELIVRESTMGAARSSDS